jgi:hypothetical protein
VFVADECRDGSRITVDHGWGIEPRGARRCDKLLPKLPEGQMRAARVDEGKSSRIPKSGRATVPQDNFVTVRQSVEVGQSSTNPSDEFTDWFLPMGCPQQVSVRDEIVDLLWSYF